MKTTTNNTYENNRNTQEWYAGENTQSDEKDIQWENKKYKTEEEQQREEHPNKTEWENT